MGRKSDSSLFSGHFHTVPYSKIDALVTNQLQSQKMCGDSQLYCHHCTKSAYSGVNCIRMHEFPQVSAKTQTIKLLRNSQKGVIESCCEIPTPSSTRAFAT